MALLLVPASVYRVDRLTEDCSRWPSVGRSAALSAAYLAGVGLLTLAWRRAARARASMREVLLAAAAVHAIALVAAPFLSYDSVCYAAIGRAMSAFGGTPYAPLSAALPVDDPLYVALPAAWHHTPSAYWGGWNALSAAIARAAGTNLPLALHLFQLVGMAAILGAAWLTGRAVAEHRNDPDAGARAAALVAFSPLALVEATFNAHNDALLALSVALGVLFIARGRPLMGLLAFGGGLAVKASALLVVGMQAVAAALARIPRRLSRLAFEPRLLVVAGLCAVAVGGLALYALLTRFPTLHAFTAVVGRPDELYPHCTRSVECLPRAALHLGLDRPMAAFVVGLAFRAAGALWLLYAAWRAALPWLSRTASLRTTASPSSATSESLGWLGTGLFVYYLFFHGFMQSWYLLSLLPLLPFATARMRPLMELFCTTSLAYYAIRLTLACESAPVPTVAKEISEAALVILPPAIALFVEVHRWRTRRRAAAEPVALPAETEDLAA
jgi:hypothetical protein